jgi:hypothetical protein
LADTWGTIKTEIEAENDLTEEVFVDAAELLYYANSALEDIEKEIHTLNDKYFAANTPLVLVSGTATYSLPTDIYATKITGIIYDDGSTKYEIKPLVDLNKIPLVSATSRYQYRIINNVATGLQIKLYPTAYENSSANVTIYYRRKIKKFTDTTTTLDVPEGKEFLKQFVTDKAVNKERMTPDALESAALQRKRKQLLDSLENQIDDNNNDIGVDTSYYEEFLNGRY